MFVHINGVLSPQTCVQHIIKSCTIPWLSNGPRHQHADTTVENHRACYRRQHEYAYQGFLRLVDVKDRDSSQGHVIKVQAACSRHQNTRCI